MTTPIFPLLPDGGSHCTERIEFATAVSQASNGSETRKRLRGLPRHSFSATFLAVNQGAAAEALALARAGLVHVPYACHAASAAATDLVDQGLNVDAPFVVAGLLDGSVAKLAWHGALAARWVAPSADAYLTGSREITWRSDRLFSVPLTFAFTDAFREQMPVVASLDFPCRHNWTTTPSEAISAETDTADFGRRFLLQQRFIKRSVKLSVLLTDRAAIQAFRAWFYAVAGRFNAFSYHFPPDATAHAWRLGSDYVDIEYVTRNVATVQLELVDLTA